MTTLGLEYLKHTEMQRSNRAKEAQAAAELSETRRANVANELIKGKTLEENMRHNAATESETRRSNLVQEDHWATQHELERLKQAETQRHNVATESIDRTEVIIKGFDMLSKAKEREHNTLIKLVDLIPLVGNN